MKSLLNPKDRVVLHLSAYKIQRKKYDMPLAVTREGIAKATGVGLSHASRQISKLKEKGYLIKVNGRAKGKNRNQDFYFLNAKGKKYAESLKKRMKKMQIKMIGINGAPQKMGLNEAIDYLIDAGISDVNKLDICKFTSAEGVLYIKELEKSRKERYIDFTERVPKITHFFGREEELNKLNEWIADKEKHNIIFIHGMAGIGKTTLAAKLIEDYQESKHLFWHDFNELDTLRGILLKLGDFLTELGNNHLELFMRTRTSLDFHEISRILGKSIGKLDAIIIFDDFQKSDDQIRKFFVYFLGMLSPSSQTKMLVLSREIVPFYDSRDVLDNETVAELRLEGLDFESTKKLLSEKEIDEQDFEEIYMFTAGNPLFLEFFQSESHLERFVHDELFSKLKENERKILGCLSIYRYPVTEETLAVHGDIDFETLYTLTQKSLVKLDAQDRYFLHDIIKRFFYSRLSRSKRRYYHRLTAKGFESGKDASHIIEAIYHYQEAGDLTPASELALEYSSMIIDGGYATDLLGILERFVEKDLESKIWSEILFTKGKTSYIVGEWKKALHYLTECSDLSTVIHNDELKVKAICQSGHILEEHNELEKALSTFKNSLLISKKANYLLGMAESYRGLGRIHWRSSRHQKAIDNYKKSLEISNKEDFYDLSGSTYIDLGNAYDERCELSKAVECYDTSIALLTKGKNVNETARAYGNLGVAYRHYNNYNKAIKYHKKQLDLLKNSDYLIQMGYGYSWIGYCYAKINDFKNAKRYAEKAEEIALKIENQNVMFDVQLTYALIYANQNKWDEALNYFQRSIKDAKEVNAFFPLAETYFEVGQIYQKMGDKKNAKKNFKHAAKLYKRLGLNKNEFVKAKLESVGYKSEI